MVFLMAVFTILLVICIDSLWIATYDDIGNQILDTKFNIYFDWVIINNIIRSMLYVLIICLWGYYILIAEDKSNIDWPFIVGSLLFCVGPYGFFMYGARRYILDICNYLGYPWFFKPYPYRKFWISAEITEAMKRSEYSLNDGDLDLDHIEHQGLWGNATWTFSSFKNTMRGSRYEIDSYGGYSQQKCVIMGKLCRCQMVVMKFEP